MREIECQGHPRAEGQQRRGRDLHRDFHRPIARPILRPDLVEHEGDAGGDGDDRRKEGQLHVRDEHPQVLLVRLDLQPPPLLKEREFLDM